MVPMRLVAVFVLILLAAVSAALGQKLPKIELSPTVTKLLASSAVSDAEKRALSIFHGQWQKLADLTVSEQAAIAWQRYDLTHPSLSNELVPALLRAKAALGRGDPGSALGLLQDDDSLAAMLVGARALEQLGRGADAAGRLKLWRQNLDTDSIDTAPQLTAAAEALVMLARLEGSPARDYHLAMKLLGKAHGEIDRLYWPAAVSEAKLLQEKDNAAQAFAALTDALQLNPRASEAWYLLGVQFADHFRFQDAEQCIGKLRQINEQHPLAELLEVRTLLTQRDARSALAIIEKLLGRYPNHRLAVALLAAGKAMKYDQPGLNDALERYDKLAPGDPLAYATVGKFLSFTRQYAPAEAMLRAAIRRQPNWAWPHVELGLLLMQSGDEPKALVELNRAATLDPFNRRVHNQLKLVQELLGYERIETEHFIIRYKKGIDQVLARDMPTELEQMYAELTQIFEHKPARKTLIEILPDQQWFAVRITGIPEVWTVAACTGDVIAITPPRPGVKLQGNFDWARVLRHEFTHTITLSKTHNRLPHWFTEACSVSQEIGGRDYQTCLLLAQALRKEKLFDLDQINWAFVRPRKPADRPLAYAQAHWMLQYLTEAYGHKSVVRLLELFGEGAEGKAAIVEVTRRSPEDFMTQFTAWARRQVRRWGLGPKPKIAELADSASGEFKGTDQRLGELLAQHPDHPDLLLAAARRALEGTDAESARRAVLRYAAARPVDLWPYQALVRLAATGHTRHAIGALQKLDSQAQDTGQWAYRLARIHRSGGALDQAAGAIRRAMHREPYNGTYRELAAAIDLQRDDLPAALHHLQSMATLEPKRAIHQVRLAKLYAKMGRTDQATQAAKAAVQLDPEAPVQQFLP